MGTKEWISKMALALALFAQGIGVYAQDKTERKSEHQPQVERREVEIIMQGPGTEARLGPPPPPPAAGGDNTFVFVSTEMSFDGKIVKGAPYSAQAVTEMVQTLADGNRIVRKNTANVYRDSEGRTRRDQTLGAIGPYSVAGDPPQTFFINDTVAGVNYILDPRTKTARKLAFHFRFMKQAEAAGSPKTQVAPLPESKPRVQLYTFSTPVVPPPPDAAGQVFYFDGSTPGVEPKKESLGEQVFDDGVKAVGTRVTMTIPAGAIGNEQPINIVSERWYSKELQAIVMTRHSDPRHGETIYRLTNISRSEPAHTLFEVPGDYTIKETPPMLPRTFRKRMPAPPAAPDDL